GGGGVRRRLAGAGLIGAGGGAGPAPTAPAFPAAAERVADLDELWRFVDETYPFGAKTVDWAAVREAYRDRVAAAADRRALVRAFEDVLDELYDAHSHLGTNYDHSWQLVPPA